MKYIIKKTIFGDFKLTTKDNWFAYISNAREIRTLSPSQGFHEVEDVIDYAVRYLGIPREDIEVI
ncbi:MAG: hypothetical protein K6D91_06110 [Prevotella sp.]|nr:hypothetical protein [Prevotella sp.]